MFPLRHMKSEQRGAECTYILQRQLLAMDKSRINRVSSHLRPALVRAACTTHRSLCKTPFRSLCPYYFYPRRASLQCPDFCRSSPTLMLRVSHLRCKTLSTMVISFHTTLSSRPAAAMGMKTCTHSNHFVGLTSVSIQPAPFCPSVPISLSAGN